MLGTCVPPAPGSAQATSVQVISRISSPSAPVTAAGTFSSWDALIKGVFSSKEMQVHF